jgi:hypothetical protein
MLSYIIGGNFNEDDISEAERMVADGIKEKLKVDDPDRFYPAYEALVTKEYLTAPPRLETLTVFMVYLAAFTCNDDVFDALPYKNGLVYKETVSTHTHRSKNEWTIAFGILN